MVSALFRFRVRVEVVFQYQLNDAVLEHPIIHRTRDFPAGSRLGISQVKTCNGMLQQGDVIAMVCDNARFEALNRKCRSAFVKSGDGIA